MSKLSNKVAVATGGSSGIGLATARRFIAEGAQVVIAGRNQEALDAAVAELGDRATGIRGDVAVTWPSGILALAEANAAEPFFDET